MAPSGVGGEHSGWSRPHTRRRPRRPLALTHDRSAGALVLASRAGGRPVAVFPEVVVFVVEVDQLVFELLVVVIELVVVLVVLVVVLVIIEVVEIIVLVLVIVVKIIVIVQILVVDVVVQVVFIARGQRPFRRRELL